MKFNFGIIFLSCFIILNSCKKKDTTQSDVAFQTNLSNVSYGADPAQVMDVYLPPNRAATETKVIVMIHGGGWSAGDKADMNPFVDSFQMRLPNYAIFNINYRLANAGLNLFPTQENDVKAAIEFIYSQRFKYAISDKFALLGASAGAHLALLHAYKYENPVKIRTVVDFFGPADMTAMYNNPALPGGEFPIFGVTGTTPSLNLSLYETSSPVNYVVPGSTPTIIFHGGVDGIVRHEQSDTLFARLDSANVPAKYVIYPTQNHGWVNSDTLTNSFNFTQAFLNTYMQ